MPAAHDCSSSMPSSANITPGPFCRDMASPGISTVRGAHEVSAALPAGVAPT